MAWTRKSGASQGIVGSIASRLTETILHVPRDQALDLVMHPAPQRQQMEHAGVCLAEEAGADQLRVGILDSGDSNAAAWKPHSREARHGWGSHHAGFS